MNVPATILFAVLSLSLAWSQTHSVNPAIVDGEELRYKVKWQLFVRLGTITIRTFRDTMCTEPYFYKVAMDVESNPSLSFVSIREHNESLVDVNRMASVRFHAIQGNGNDRFRVAHEYDTTARTASCTRTGLNSGNSLGQSTLNNVDPSDERSMAEGMYRVLTDSSLRARLFSREKSSTMHLELFRESAMTSAGFSRLGNGLQPARYVVTKPHVLPEGALALYRMGNGSQH